MNDILNLRSPEWMHDERRACALPSDYDAPLIQAAADQWIPPTHVGEREAVRLCAGCPSAIKNKCLEYALDRPELEGVWGGTTTAERENLRKGEVA